MNIQTVALNLRNTIAGKEILLKELYKNRLYPQSDDVRRQSNDLLGYVEANIDELKRILKDVEQCEPSLPGEGNNYEDRDE